MSYKLSIRDINYLKPLCLFGNAFAITPWYRFGTHSLVRPALAKLYALFLIAMVVLGMFGILHDELRNQRHVFYRAQNLVDMLGDLSLTLLIVLIITNAVFCNGDKWSLLLNTLEYIDVKLHNKGTLQAHPFKNFYLLFTIKLAVFVGCTAYQTFAWFNYLGISFSRRSLWFILCVCYKMFTVVLLNSLIESFKVRYEDLNAMLRKIVAKFPEQGTLLNVHLLRDIGRDYRCLGDVVGIFNDIYGYQIVVLICHCGIELINNLNYVVNNANIGDQHYLMHIIIGNICMAIFIMYTFLLIVFPCDSTNQEAKKFVESCYKLQEDFYESSKERKELLRLGTYAATFIPEFQAAGFFVVQRSAVFGLIGTVATYFIIVIQFNEEELSKTRSLT